MFVFDALPMAASPVIIEGFRGDEFSPVKNAEGVDSPLTCKNHQKQQAARWLEKVGVKLEADAEGVADFSTSKFPRSSPPMRKISRRSGKKCPTGQTSKTGFYI